MRGMRATLRDIGVPLVPEKIVPKMTGIKEPCKYGDGFKGKAQKKKQANGQKRKKKLQ